ncbi:MAG: hypothetical protein KAQ88_02330 [Hyphomicrobiaceae bacterium]|nr:hypothetical protein [Hyphomicrobiaceae bacterium]
MKIKFDGTIERRKKDGLDLEWVAVQFQAIGGYEMSCTLLPAVGSTEDAVVRAVASAFAKFRAANGIQEDEISQHEDDAAQASREVVRSL